MRKLLFSSFLLGIFLLSGCTQASKSDLTIDPENLNVGPEVSTATVKTSGFMKCEIYSIVNGKNEYLSELHRDYPINKFTIDNYEGEWFNVTVSDDWKDLHFEFKENTSPKQRSAMFSLNIADSFNRFTVTQEGTE